LSHIQAVDGIYHLVRAFEDEDIQHYDGEVDPIRDLETIKMELVAKDKQFADKQFEEWSHKAKKNGLDKDAIFKKETIEKVLALLDGGKNVRDKEDWNYKEIEVLNEWLFLTSKPGVYLVNLSEPDFIAKKNKWLGKIVKWVKENGDGKVVPFSAAYEKRLSEAVEADEKKKDF